jgi:hypothetical protein
MMAGTAVPQRCDETVDVILGIVEMHRRPDIVVAK